MSTLLTPTYLMDIESNMRVIAANETQRLRTNLWWKLLTKVLPSEKKSERLQWLMDTGSIQQTGHLGGYVESPDMVMNTTEFTSVPATKGLELDRVRFEDQEGDGPRVAAEWARITTDQAAYWPQKLVAKALRNGTQATSLGYDSQIFFSSAHPVNPFQTSAGTFQNRLTGAASGVFPGACPIDSSVTTDVAFANFGKAIAFINGGLVMPNGEDPRMLRARYVLTPTALVPRIQQITGAKFIAQAAATGGGGADVEAIVTAWGLAEPVECPELGSKFTNGSDTTYYIVAQQVDGDQLGALTYVEREPFGIIYNDQMTDAQLARANKLQWLTRGRNIVGYGHPYLVFRVEAS